MQRENFGKLCASLRQEVFDPRTGRVWSQEDLAKACNLGVGTIGQIERGEKVKLDNEILLSLALAFKMTNIERQRFFDLANTCQDSNYVKPKISLETVEYLKQLQQPFLLHDGLYRAIWMNHAFSEIYGLTQSYLDSIRDSDLTKYHIVRHIHDPNSPVREVYKHQIEHIELNNTLYWKYFSMGHRHNQLFNEIQSSLFESCPQFVYLWSSFHQQTFNKNIANLTRQYYSPHPHLGVLRYIGITTQLFKGECELFLVTLCPTDEKTLAVFNSLNGYGKGNVIACAPIK